MDFKLEKYSLTSYSVTPCICIIYRMRNVCLCWWFLIADSIRDQLLQYIPRNMHTIFALLCFVVVIHWLIFPYPSGLLHWHCGNLTIAPVPAKQPWWIWINTSCEFIMNDCITTIKQSTTKPCAYFLGHTVHVIKLPFCRYYSYFQDRKQRAKHYQIRSSWNNSTKGVS